MAAPLTSRSPSSPLSLHALPLRLTLVAMKATLTSKGQITIPAAIRKKLGLKPGQVLDFDEEAPCLRAVLVFDEDEMKSVLGCSKGALGRTSKEWLEETRSPVALPSKAE